MSPVGFIAGPEPGPEQRLGRGRDGGKNYRQRIDWTIFHVLNGSLRGHRLLGDGIEDFVTDWAVPVFVVATLSLWLFDRPGPWYRWKIACLSALASAGLGLLAAQLISHLWARERPFEAHPAQTLLLAPPSHEPSFPSDHAVAAFAIAFSVSLTGGRRTGALFLAAASTVAVTRIFVGLHYPGDVAGGALVGLLASLVVFLAGGNRWSPIAAALSRLTDPLVAPAWRALDSAKAKRRLRPSST
ncbi:MAG: phosphatase PAP2 family protein [Actinomycetota bacterium]|nr:phosphatase PAP2 family protein [Actinomycetota bacterium]